MVTQFDEWLRQLGQSGHGPVYPREIVRGLPWQYSFALAGDWTTAAWSGSLRLAPDTAGSTLADFTISSTYSAPNTIVTMSLTNTQVNSLPADGDADGLVWLAFDVLVIPSGSIKQRIFGGAVPISGKVTNG